MTHQEFVHAFENGTLEASDFSHEAHLQVAYHYLREHSFLEACIMMRDGIKRIAARLGKEDLYHETITLAFMSLLAERRETHPQVSWDLFLKANPDLLDRKVLRHYYTFQVISSEIARRCFVLPRREEM